MSRQYRQILMSLVAAALFFPVAVRADISGDFTLSSNLTFTSSIIGDAFTIDSKHDTFDLRSFTANFTGTGDFQINASIVGSGNVMIDLADPTSQVEFNTANSYTGLTTVRSGILYLDTPGGGNNG